MSHILALKDAFRAHSGEIRIEIAFMANSAKLATLHIDQSWGVDYRKELENKISALPSIRTFKWE